jgi:hypothetical protein
MAADKRAELLATIQKACKESGSLLAGYYLENVFGLFLMWSL